MSPLRPLLRVPIRSLLNQQRRYESNTPSKPVNPHANFYRENGRPLLKNFLIAVATYQIIYWGWMKLESIETKKAKGGEMQLLEGEIRKLSGEREK